MTKIKAFGRTKEEIICEKKKISETFNKWNKIYIYIQFRPTIVPYQC